MALVKYQRPLSGILVSELVDEFFNQAAGMRQKGFIPDMDISETDRSYEIQLYVPGMNKDEISVSLEKELLSIRGERKRVEEQEKKYHRIETRYGEFERSLQLPDDVDPESVKAEYKDGVLSITIDKREEQLSKQIKIS